MRELLVCLCQLTGGANILQLFLCSVAPGNCVFLCVFGGSEDEVNNEPGFWGGSLGVQLFLGEMNKGNKGTKTWSIDYSTWPMTDAALCAVHEDCP